MPFTICHPAAVLPFRRVIGEGRLPFAAFVIGTMTPDFEYLLRLEPLALVSHTWRGLALFCLPIGVLTLAMWTFLLEAPMRSLLALPAPPHTDAWPLRARGWAVALAALALGSATHLVWDAFTHRDMWVAELFPLLRTKAFTVLGYVVPWYNVMQLLSSITGGAIVLIWLLRLLRSQQAMDGWWPVTLRTAWRRRAWLALLCCALAAGAWNSTRRGLMTDPTRAKIVIGRVVVGAMSGLALALVGYGVLMRRTVRRG